MACTESTYTLYYTTTIILVQNIAVSQHVQQNCSTECTMGCKIACFVILALLFDSCTKLMKNKR